MVAYVLAALIVSPAPQPQEWTTPHKVVVNHKEGEIDIYLPNHIRAGQTLSGSVFAVPNGEDYATQHANQQWLDACNLVIGGRKLRVADTMFTLTVPGKAEALTVAVNDGADKQIGAADLKISSEQYELPSGFSFTSMVRAGAPIAVFGAFDGNRSTTFASFGGRPVGILAEGQDECFVTSPADRFGPSTFRISKNGTSFSHQVNLLGFTYMTPGKPTKSGANSSIGVEVDGLQGADPSAFPIRVELQSDNPRVMGFLGSNPSVYELEITSRDAKSGHFIQAVPTRARASGRYSIIGNLYSPISRN